MKVTVIGGSPEVIDVEEKDGKLLGEDGTEYVMEHTSGIYHFVRLAEEAVDEAEDIAAEVEDELGVGDGVKAETEQIEGYVEQAEDALAGGLKAEPVEENNTAPADESGLHHGAIQGDAESPEA